MELLYSKNTLHLPNFISPSCEYIELGAGTTCYQVQGPPAADLVVMIHGLSTWSFDVAGFKESFLSKGYRVLTYDLYGRGFSDAPDAVYNVKLFVSQLAELLYKIDISDKPFHLLGISMGGGIASTFAVTFPEKIKTLTLVAPVGLMELPLSAKLTRFPILADLLYPIIGPTILVSRVKGGFTEQQLTQWAEKIKSIERLVQYQLDYNPSYFPAMLSTTRHFEFTSMQYTYEKLGTLEIPVLVLWGDKDTVVSTSCSKELLKLVPRAKLNVYKDGGHLFFETDQKKVTEDALQFVGQYSIL